jgi:hypothetical protein
LEQGPPEFARLRKVIEAIGYGRIREIVIEAGLPAAVVAQVRISLRENVVGRLRKLKQAEGRAIKEASCLRGSPIGFQGEAVDMARPAKYTRRCRRGERFTFRAS